MKYKTLDEIPAYNYLKFMENPNPKLLCDYEPKEDEFPELLKNWDSIFQGYIDFMGLGAKWERIIRQENKISKLIVKRWTNGHKHLQTIINIERKKLDKLREVSGVYDFYEESAVVSKYMGFAVNLKQISAKEFFSYIKLMQKDG